MTYVAILWHMHQPYYEDLATGEHVLPWVRMHGLKDYYGMVALMREFPDVQLTFNLVPSLLVQLEAFAGERARDWHLELGLKPAAALTDNDRAIILSEFFHAPRGRMIELYPRYAELLQERDRNGGYTDADFLDLQVWHKLAWVDPFYLDSDPRVGRLIEKQRHFTEEDKLELRAVELEILRRVIPEYREAAQRGQVELSTSPFYHPILPLLCDTDVYLRTHPAAAVPRPPYRQPEDAAEQLARARQCHLRLFGHEPLGLWPSEGSVSDAAAELAANAGFHWMATDEAILGRSINREFRRDAYGWLDDPEPLYRAYSVQSGASQIGYLFRDHALSDLIGFVYAGWDPEDAASDFVNRLAESGRRFSAASGGEEATISIILDGENAWEHFAGGGRPFLRALYGKLSGHRELKTVKMRDAAARSPRALAGIFPGSWIDGNFFIWIGHGDDLRAWRQLRDARQMFDRAATAARPQDRECAYQELLIAEGSDWFWWYGDDHSSDHDLEFDDLFRRHLRNVYQMLGHAIPEELFVTNISTSHVPLSLVAPVGLLTPVLDGEVSSYFEWLPAGLVETDVPSGTMTGGERREPVLRHLLFGFDLEQFYLRLDLGASARHKLEEGIRCSVNFTTPPDRRLVLEHGGPTLYQRTTSGSWLPLEIASPRSAAGEILEASVSFADLGLRPGNPFAFSVSIQLAGVEVERHPAHRPVESIVPEAAFEKLHWKA
ncbi:MAG: glycoside hydrolase [Acidobacteria bacterium]|nr:glycoside hydrolase [Acidobacteriota bacterium]